MHLSPMTALIRTVLRMRRLEGTLAGVLLLGLAEILFHVPRHNGSLLLRSELTEHYATKADLHPTGGNASALDGREHPGRRSAWRRSSPSVWGA